MIASLIAFFAIQTGRGKVVKPGERSGAGRENRAIVLISVFCEKPKGLLRETEAWTAPTDGLLAGFQPPT
ncbi:hypothetical protein N8813_05190 [bacterium]|nr:hypothetical protein [bacterium]